MTKKDLGSITRTGLAGIPYIGGVLAQGWSEWDTSRRFARIESVIVEIGILLARFSNFKPESLTDSEYQLLEEVLRRVQVEHCENKRHQYAKLLTECWTSAKNEPFDKRLLFIKALESFDSLHIKILSVLADLKDDEEKYPTPKDIAELLGIDDDLKVSLYPHLDLITREYGFVVRSWTLGGNDRGTLLAARGWGPENLVSKCGHKITLLGRQFLEYISE